MWTGGDRLGHTPTTGLNGANEHQGESWGASPGHTSDEVEITGYQTKILNYFDARQTSAAVEGINNKARVITKRTYGLKSAKSLWDRLILDLNRASQAIGYSIEHIRQMAKGLKALFDWSCT